MQSFTAKTKSESEKKEKAAAGKLIIRAGDLRSLHVIERLSKTHHR